MYGIPNPKLDKKIVQRRVDLMAEEGVKFITGTEVGKDIAAEKILKDNHAVLLCGGATKPRDLPIEGRTLRGIHFAMEFLRGRTLREEMDEREPLDVREAASIAIDIASALGEVHARGIVHRDINPRNIFLLDRSHEEGRQGRRHHR